MTAGFNIAAQPGASQGAAALGATGQVGLFGKSSGAATGFEALMAAFFGGQAMGEAGLAGTPAASPAASVGPQSSLLAVGETLEGAEPEATTEPAIQSSEASDGSVTLEAQAVAMLLAQPATAQPVASQATTSEAIAPENAGAGDPTELMGAKPRAAAAAATATARTPLDIPTDEPEVADLPAVAADPVQVADASPEPAPPHVAKPAPRAAEAAPAAAPAAYAAPKVEAAAPATPEAAPVQPEAPPAAMQVAESQVAAAPPPAVADPTAPRAGARTEPSKRGEAASAAAAPATTAPVSATSGPVAAIAPTAETADGGAAQDDGDRPLVAAEKLDGPDQDDATQQPAGVQAASASAESAEPARAATPVRGSPETVAALAAEIVKKLDGRTTRFDVELNPGDLGRVDVRIEIGAHGRLTAAMAFENPQAAAELKNRADELQKALEQAGFDLSGGLSFDVANDPSGGRSFADQTPSDLGGQARGRAFQAALDTAGESADAALASALAYRSRPASGVDIRI